MPIQYKLGAGVCAGLLVLIGALTAIVPAVNDPEANLAKVGKGIAAGPKNTEEAKNQLQELDKTVQRFLEKFGNLPKTELAVRIQKNLNPSIFEARVFDLPRDLKIAEIDTVLMASDYLVIKTGNGAKVEPIGGLEVYQDGKIVVEASSPFLVLIGHSTGTTASHRPQVKVYALLPEEVADRTSKSAPNFLGDGNIAFAKNGKDLILDQSVFSVGTAEGIFEGRNPTDDETVHYKLEWKNGHYNLQEDSGSGQISALYAFAHCLKHPEDIKRYAAFLSDDAKAFITAFKSADSTDLQFQLKKAGTTEAPGRHSRRHPAPAINNYILSSKKSGIAVSLTRVPDPQKPLWMVATAKDAPILPSLAAGVGDGKASAGPPQSDSSKTDKEKSDQAKLNNEKANKDDSDKDKSTAQKKDKVEKPVTTEPTTSPISTAPADSDSHKTDKADKTDKSEKADKADKKNSKETADSSASSPYAAKSTLGGTGAQADAKTKIKVRSGPGVDYHSVAEIQPGTDLKIVSKKNGWYKVQVSGKEGYVYGGYVSDKNSDAYTTATITKSKVVADEHNKPIASISKGDRYVVLGGLKNDKYKVQLANGKVGYVDKDAVDVKVDEPQFVP